MANVIRTYKDRLFCALFGSEERKNLTLELYNALNGTNYTNAEDIQINTIEDVVYLGMRNDVSFLLANEINLYEHQSTWSPNIPLRAFYYVEHVVESYLYDTGKNNEVYGNKLVKIPTLKIVVLYNVNEKSSTDAIFKKCSFNSETEWQPPLRFFLSQANASCILCVNLVFRFVTTAFFTAEYRAYGSPTITNNFFALVIPV